jgi:hypothetical protein
MSYRHSHDRQPRGQRRRLLLAWFVPVLLAAGCAGTPAPVPASGASGAAVEATGTGPVTAKWTKIVRGVNQMRCEAGPIGDGNDPQVGPNEPLTDLSVSCSDDRSVTLDQLRAPLLNPHICWSELEKLRRSNRHVLAVRAPTRDNPYHCLLSVITPKEFVSRSFWRN